MSTRTENDVDVSFLDYGAFGLLAAVLVGAGLFLRNWFNREQDHQIKRNEVEREDRIENNIQEREDRRELNQQFALLVDRDVQAKATLAEVLSDLCQEVRGGQSGIINTLSKMAEKMDLNETRAAERHQQTTAMSVEILESLRSMNGERKQREKKGE